MKGSTPQRKIIWALPVGIVVLVVLAIVIGLVSCGTEPPSPTAEAAGLTTTPQPTAEESGTTPTLQPAATPHPTSQATPTPNPTTRVSTINDCIREARDSSYVDSIRINTIANTDPNELTDRQRLEWYEFFSNTNSDLRGACIAFWSEEITKENADKRNKQYGETGGNGEGCVDWVKRRISEETGGNDLGGERATWIDTLALLERPYLSLTTAERLILRDHIEDDSDCRRYYPQLFSGRWIPLFERE